MAANKIVAQPGTITGSIGVVAGKMFFSEFWDKLGVSWDELHTSTNATMWSINQDYTPQQWAQFQNWLDRIYNDFTTKAAQGRGLSKEQILEVAKGQVWTGEDAKAHGLVDQLGGFPMALKLVREVIDIPKDAEIRLKVFPKRKSPIKQILEALLGDEDESNETVTLATVARAIKIIQPIARLAKQVGLISEPGVLRMPYAEPVR
jgi:protease-4